MKTGRLMYPGRSRLNDVARRGDPDTKPLTDLEQRVYDALLPDQARWGRVTTVRIAFLVGERSSTVHLALGRLAQRGLVRSTRVGRFTAWEAIQ